MRLSSHAWVLKLYWRNSRGPTDFARLIRGRYLYGRKVSAESIGTVRVRPGTTDMSVVGEVLAGAYDTALNNVGEGQIVDLGAHIGLVARACLNRYPNRKVVTVEANPANVELLRRNVPDAEVIARPVAATHRTVGLTDDRLDGCRITGSGDMETVTMDDIPGHIALLKVDVEGAEQELFADCLPWIGRVDTIVCECHHPYTGDDMLAAIRAGGGTPVVLDRLDLPQFGYDLLTVSV